MKRLTFIAAVGVAACLLSCRTQKTMTDADLNSTLSYADTTKTVVDTDIHKRIDTDTTQTAATYEGVGVIEFVDGGGKVSIDSTGIVILGVKNIKSRRKGSFVQKKSAVKKVDEVAAHREQLSGVKVDRTRHEKHTEKKEPARKWYETALARLGLGVCIAILILWLSLCLKKKFFKLSD